MRGRDIVTVPRTIDDLWREFEALSASNNWSAASRILATLLDREPGSAFVLLQMSYVESLHGSYRKARDFALQACRAGSDDVGILKDICNRLRTFNEVLELREFITKVCDKSQISPSLLVSFAGQLNNLNDSHGAIALLDHAKTAHRLSPEVMVARASTLIHLGRFDEAEAELRRALVAVPVHAYAHWLLSRLRKQTKTSNHIKSLTRTLQTTTSSAGVTLLAFALHKEFDDLGDHAEAWKALDYGCRVKRSISEYRSADSKQLINRLIDTTAGAGAKASGSSLANRVPIFIVGMHRSGTTLLEQLLAGHSEINAIGEIYDFTSSMRYATDHHCKGVIDTTIVERAGRIDFASVGSGYLAAVDWRMDQRRFFTDKLPSNFLNIGFIRQALPNAKILHMTRHPIETCFSNLRELYSDANPYSYDQVELADYFLDYQRLMRHWHVAHPGQILDVDYSSLTRDPETTIRDVAGFCGFSFEPAMLDIASRTRSVSTASAVQVRNSVVTRTQPKWIPYAEHLQPLIQRLELSGK